LYFVVDKSKLDRTPDMEDTYENVLTKNLCYNTVAATTDDSDAL